MATKIRVKTLDHKIFEIDYEIARCSETISMMLDICIDRNVEPKDVIIPFRDWVHSKELTWILKWFKCHKQTIESTQGDTISEASLPELIDTESKCLKQTDKGAGEAVSLTEKEEISVESVEAMDQSSLMDLIVTVNYLHIGILLEFLCRIITDMVVGKTYEEICKACSTKRQLTGDEIEYLYNENPCLLLGQCNDDELESTAERVDCKYFACGEYCNEDLHCNEQGSVETHSSKWMNNKEKED